MSIFVQDVGVDVEIQLLHHTKIVDVSKVDAVGFVLHFTSGCRRMGE